MRIIAGRYRGTRLVPIGVTHTQLRPTSARVRTVVFDLLTNSTLGNCVKGARVLDLFAGTGAMGLEAISRGAQCAHFVEYHKSSVKLIQRNIAATRTQEKTMISRANAQSLPRYGGLFHNLVFLDPPYNKGLAHIALDNALSNGWIANGTLAIIEDLEPYERSDHFQPIFNRVIGSTAVTIGEIL